jgi:ABC-type dipeptide/oligopeptide/nickel transport system ATPase component
MSLEVILYNLDVIKFRLKVSMILITYDIEVAAKIANKTAVIYAEKIVEVDTVDEALNKPLHPYTKALLDSMPTIKEDKIPNRAVACHIYFKILIFFNSK